MLNHKAKILFFAETVTLAHMARPAVLATAAAGEFETFLAASPVYDKLFAFNNVRRLNLSSLSSNIFLSRLAGGKPVYTSAEIVKYVEEDLHIIDDVKPSIIVGDFRVSLYISAKIAKIPYVSITNAYWSPQIEQHYIVPELPFVKLFGPTIGQWLFNVGRPIAFALHAQPFIAVCKKYGVKPPGKDIRSIYTSADLTLFSDISELYAGASQLQAPHFIGPVLWSPDLPLPQWWADIPTNKPRIYVTMGSSGNKGTLPLIMKTLSDLECTSIVAGAGMPTQASLPRNSYFADYLPGDQAASIADIVICNGGSPTTQQALAAGKPVIGIPTNLDQYLNMANIVRFGAGNYLRADNLDDRALKAAVKTILETARVRQRAAEIGRIMTHYDARATFLSSIKKHLSIQRHL